MKVSMKQALYNHYYAEELWKEYLLHRTQKNLDLFHSVVKGINCFTEEGQCK